MKNTQSGRSMVEMLGVLAIIGMLSVGGIWGLSEAIFKHKLNQHAAQISWILNVIATHQYDGVSNPDPTKFYSLIPFLKYKAPGGIPEGISIGETAKMLNNPSFRINEYSSQCLIDAFGNVIIPFTYQAPFQGQTPIVICVPQSGDEGVSLCRNVLSALQPIYKENPKRMYEIKVWFSKKVMVFNEKYDFANMTAVQILNFCYDNFSEQDNERYFYINFHNKRYL